MGRFLCLRLSCLHSPESTEPYSSASRDHYTVRWKTMKSRVEYWAICSFARSFTRTSHSFTCSAPHRSFCSRTPKRYSFTRFAALIQLMGKRFMSLKLMRLFHAISTRSAAVAPLPPSPLYAFPPLITTVESRNKGSQGTNNFYPL